MPILNGSEIKKGIEASELILGAARSQDGKVLVEAASYDLRAGIVLWREKDSDDLMIRYFDSNQSVQSVVTLQPGQMVFVITEEELKLSSVISGTVYSRNRLQKENILALNAGHVDPGYEGPILIRLINLGAQPWPITLGQAVFTVVFHTVDRDPSFKGPDRRTREETLEAAKKTAVGAFSNPFHDLYKVEISRQLNEHYSKAESNIRSALNKDFYPRRELSLLLIEIGAAIVALLFVLTRMPWDKVWHVLRCLLHLA
jgi:deoxycytidine triphosphate deaminase